MSETLSTEQQTQLDLTRHYVLPFESANRRHYVEDIVAR